MQQSFGYSQIRLLAAIGDSRLCGVLPPPTLCRLVGNTPDLFAQRGGTGADLAPGRQGRVRRLASWPRGSDPCATSIAAMTCWWCWRGRRRRPTHDHRWQRDFACMNHLVGCRRPHRPSIDAVVPAPGAVRGLPQDPIPHGSGAIICATMWALPAPHGRKSDQPQRTGLVILISSK